MISLLVILHFPKITLGCTVKANLLKNLFRDIMLRHTIKSQACISPVYSCRLFDSISGKEKTIKDLIFMYTCLGQKISIERLVKSWISWTTEFT